jgi:hypothetical protein
MMDMDKRGTKECPECNNRIGNRAYKCKCGYRFVDKKTQKEIREELDAATDEEKLYAACIGAGSGRIVYAAGGGDYPKLKSLDRNTVFDFCEEVVFEGLQHKMIFSVRAIKNLIQHQYEYNSEEYESASQYVDQWYNEKMLGVDIPSGAEYNVE